MDRDDILSVGLMAGSVCIVVLALVLSIGTFVNRGVQIKADAWRDCCAIIAEGINDFARAPIDIMEWQLKKQEEYLKKQENFHRGLNEAAR